MTLTGFTPVLTSAATDPRMRTAAAQTGDVWEQLVASATLLVSHRVRVICPRIIPAARCADASALVHRHSDECVSRRSCNEGEQRPAMAAATRERQPGQMIQVVDRVLLPG